jgi:tripartite ATP-independent transporter DctM subunit
MILAAFLGSLVICVLLGIPIAFSLFISGLILMWQADFMNLAIVGQTIVIGADNFSLTAVPFFILAGEIMNAGGLAKRIVELPVVLVGHLRGGLGFVAIIACMTMACLSGSAVADAAAVGALLLPMMREAKYPAERSAGLLCAGGIIAPIIPPSVPFIIFGAVGELSILRLFMSGIFPGILMGLSLMILWTWQSRRIDLPVTPKADRTEIIKSVKESFWALVLIVIIIGGFRLGVFTATEAGAVASAYSLVVSMFVYRELRFAQLLPIFRAAAKMSGMILFLFACSTLSVWMIAFAEVPIRVIALFDPFISSPTTLMFLLMLMIAVVGMFMDVAPTILILVPVLLPLIRTAGIDPIYFGMVFVFNCSLGLITPPVGNVLNVITSVSKLRFEEVVRGVFPYIVMYLIFLALLILFPRAMVIWPLEFILPRR